MTDAFTTYDAGYVLGVLSPSDRAAFEQHLAECADCRRAVEALRTLPDLLASASLDDVERATAPAPDLPATLLPRLLAEVRRSRLRHRAVTAALGAAAAVVLVLGLVVGINGLPGHHSDTGAVQPHATGFRQLSDVSHAVPITASARLEATSWGTRVTLRCTYAPAPGGHYIGPAPTYTMVVTETSGKVQQIAAWRAQPGQPVTVQGWSSAPPSRIASVEIRDTLAQPLLRLRL